MLWASNLIYIFILGSSPKAIPLGMDYLAGKESFVKFVLPTASRLSTCEDLVRSQWNGFEQATFQTLYIYIYIIYIEFIYNLCNLGSPHEAIPLGTNYVTGKESL